MLVQCILYTVLTIGALYKVLNTGAECTSVNYVPCPRNTVHLRLPGLANMLELLDLEFQGNPHSGLDDAVNIGRVVARSALANPVFADSNPLSQDGCRRCQPEGEREAGAVPGPGKDAGRAKAEAAASRQSRVQDPGRALAKPLQAAAHRLMGTSHATLRFHMPSIHAENKPCSNRLMTMFTFLYEFHMICGFDTLDSNNVREA